MVNPGILFAALAFAIIALTAMIAVIERVLKKKQVEPTNTPEYQTTQELRELKSLKLEPQAMIDRIDALAKRTIWPSMSADESPDYSQLAAMSAEKPHVAEFASEMARALYAGQRVTESDIRSLIINLEQTLKEEGKIILVEQKHEEIEKEKFFLDAWIEGVAGRIGKRIAEWKERKAIEEQVEKNISGEYRSEIKAGIAGNEGEQKAPQRAEINPAEELKKLKVKIVPVRTKAAARSKARKDKEEYKYIESLDVLDRIKSKLGTKVQR